VGRRVSLYLTPDRLDKVGWDEPAAAIYDLIDDMEVEGATDGEGEEAEAGNDPA
jgi:hypothetical protein